MQTLGGVINVMDQDLGGKWHQNKRDTCLEIISAGTRTRNLWIRSPARSSIAPQRPHREGSVSTRTEKSTAPQGPAPTGTSPPQQHLQRPLPAWGHGRNNPGDDPYLAWQRGCSKNLDAGWYPPLWQPFRSIPGARLRAELNPGVEFIAASPSASASQHPPRCRSQGIKMKEDLAQRADNGEGSSA